MNNVQDNSELLVTFAKKEIVILLNRSLLERLKMKNKGNVKLVKAIDKLIYDIIDNEWNTQIELKQIRPDADCVHGDEFYFLNIDTHRTMILVEFDENRCVRVIWTGTHQQYELTFRNNRNTIKKWLRDNELI